MDLTVWAPLRVERQWLRWWDSSDVRFPDPFHADTVRRELRNDARALLQPRTRLAALPDLVRRHRSLPLAGLVLHWSRSGSTAFLRAAGSDPSVLALSEPPVVDEILRTDSALVGPMIEALTQPRSAEHRVAVIKLDAWSALELPTLRRALPNVPWAFVWRDPLAVLQSHATGGPGAHMVPQVLDPKLFGMSREEAAHVPLEVYRARVLATLARSALDARDDQATFVEHPHLAEELPGILASWGLPSTGVREALTRDAKQPSSPYQPSLPDVDDAVRAACATYLDDIVDELRHG